MRTKATVLDHILDSHNSSLFLKPTLSSDALIDLLVDSQLSVLCNFCKLYIGTSTSVLFFFYLTPFCLVYTVLILGYIDEL